MWSKFNKIKHPETSWSYIRDARDYALLHGLVMRYPSMSNDNCVAHIPFTLFPSPFPASLYQECLEIQPFVSSLMLKIANDSVFMEETLADIVQVDDFTRNLLDVNRTVQKEGLAQPILSCINRSDYMLDKHKNNGKDLMRIRQVEVNAIASSMSAHSHNTKLMHDYLMSKYQINLKPEDGVEFPDNGSLDLVANGLIDAYDSYGKRDCYILFVTEERSFNFSDHVLIELAIHKTRPDIRIVRRSFNDLPGITKLGPNKELLVDDDKKEIALVYFRQGYDPSNYNFSEAWSTRLLLERSRAIKCPSINFHLSGAKKFQQVLNDQDKLENFLSASEAKRLAQMFCKFWPLVAGSQEGEEGFKMGLESPEHLVLKPQREGGGHNIFGENIKSFLSQITKPEDRSQYILMEYINSPCERNWLLLHDEDATKDRTRMDCNDRLVSELGIFGSILADGYHIRSNKFAGYLVRSKKYGVMEGGVASGYAGLSSLMLINDESRNNIDLSLFFDE